ncbi:MAG: DUF3048 domain-containing protein [Lachnospiraceae bacterium]|nr:DUF3048 domain-containing protein [Lachnospiraceae bacterium]
MKKKLVSIMLCVGLAATMLAGCAGSDSGSATEPTVSDIAQPIIDETEKTEEDAVTEEPVEEEVKTGFTLLKNEDAPEGFVYSELSGELIDASLENQRPIAAMVDNEKTALDHYGVNEGDIVYEMVNSLLNDRVTRLMVLVKDWEKTERLGNIRSARTTNCMLVCEWNAVMCHDGGPVYINDYVKTESLDNISGVFTRIKNGKPSEFTEYITGDDLQKYLKNSSTISSEYTSYYTGPHFQFADQNALEACNYKSEKEAKSEIILPFPHNASELHYDEDNGTYDYYEYGGPHVDGTTGEVLTFKNVILQKASMTAYDGNGYMYYTIGGEGEGYYITDGKCVPITWHKGLNLEANTEYFDSEGNPIVLNAGKTYIGLVPDDTWDTLVIK